MCCRWSLAALFLVPSIVRADDISAKVVPDGIEFKSGSVLVAKYSVDPKYSKPFLYPVFAPGNVPVTRAYPLEPAAPGGSNDHIHQKSVWFCHGDVIPEGIEMKIKAADKTNKGVDFWSESKDKDGTKRHGQIKCVKISEPKTAATNQISWPRLPARVYQAAAKMTGRVQFRARNFNGRAGSDDSTCYRPWRTPAPH